MSSTTDATATRLDRALNEDITVTDETHSYTVKGETGTKYNIIICGDGTHACSCPDFKNRGSQHNHPCKHIIACRMYKKKPTCQYGAQCYRRELNHRADYLHPTNPTDQ